MSATSSIVVVTPDVSGRWSACTMAALTLGILKPILRSLVVSSGTCMQNKIEWGCLHWMYPWLRLEGTDRILNIDAFFTPTGFAIYGCIFAKP